jgi:hypothetical protein
MNKRKLSRLMHERVSTLQSWKCYFFCRDFEYVLRGMCFEYVPRGLYIWDFRFPLFESFGSYGHPHLSYSNRLYERAGFVGKGTSEEAIVDFIMSSPEAQSAFAPHDKLTELSDFVHFLESSPGFSRHAPSRLAVATALLLLGQEPRAVSMLDDLVSVFNEDLDHPANQKGAAICNLLQTTLRQGGLAAVRAQLDQIRQENLQKLGVAS